LDFLKAVANHGEWTRKLISVGCPSPDILEFAKFVCGCWFKLAETHLDEAQKALSVNAERSVFSRAYYAAYNASKAARYLVQGWVSLHGDDHGKASTNLPQDFPNVAQWSQDMINLYEHRQRADYDNWSDTSASNTLTPADAVTKAREFVEETRGYLNGKFGAFL